MKRFAGHAVAPATIDARCPTERLGGCLRRFRGRTSSGFRSPQGFYRYEPITPVVLNAGRSYVVVGDSIPPCDKAVNDPDGLVWAPETRFVRYRTGHGQFGFPGAEAPGQLWMIANFMFLPVSTTTSSPTP